MGILDVSSNFQLSRRELLGVTAASASTFTFSGQSLANIDFSKPVRFGLISDIHKDVMHDADQRLKSFVDTMNAKKVDFVLQLGDFCIPTKANLGFMEIWNSFSGPRHHVLGNHDMDGDGNERPDDSYAWKRSETVDYWDMKSNYYSFDLNGLHFVILDGNDKKPDGQSGYRRWVGEAQLRWLADDLAKTKLPTLAFVHQSPERVSSIENGKSVREAFEKANREAKQPKVLACFTGHHHRDYVRKLGSVLYPQINSASYNWLGGKYLHVRYSEEIDQKYPYIKYTAPYKDSLFALVTVDLAQGTMSLEGKRSEFVGPSPWELGASKEDLEAATLKPEISSWKNQIPVNS